jgi:hypothetical protein
MQQRSYCSHFILNARTVTVKHATALAKGKECAPTVEFEWGVDAMKIR